MQTLLTVLTQKSATHQAFRMAPAQLGYLVGRIAVGQRPWLLYLKEQLARLPHQFSNALAFRNSLACVAAMFKRILIASWGA